MAKLFLNSIFIYLTIIILSITQNALATYLSNLSLSFNNCGCLNTDLISSSVLLQWKMNVGHALPTRAALPIRYITTAPCRRRCTLRKAQTRKLSDLTLGTSRRPFCVPLASRNRWIVSPASKVSSMISLKKVVHADFGVFSYSIQPLLPMRPKTHILC